MQLEIRCAPCAGLLDSQPGGPQLPAGRESATVLAEMPSQRRSARRSHVALGRESRPVHGARPTESSKRGASCSRSPSSQPRRRSLSKKVAGQNFAEGFVGHGTAFVPLIVLLSPGFCQLLAYATSEMSGGRWTDGRWLTPAVESGATGLVQACVDQGAEGCLTETFAAATAAAPTTKAVQFLVAFAALALGLDKALPGRLEEGPVTRTGHVPQYVDNGVAHCAVFSAIFALGSNFGAGLYDFGIIYDVFPAAVSVLNIFGVLLVGLLYYKGLNFPSTADCGSSGSFLSDYAWGTELYPKICGVDVKRFINCRFSMTFWMLSGLSFAWKSYSLHHIVDWGLLLSAVSTYLYLVKFFVWEIGYLRSIDIIVDRAGWIQWGCLVFVPAVYSFHTRLLVLSPSGLPLEIALPIFAFGMCGVWLNFAADRQRQLFREAEGNLLIWGEEPVYVAAKWQAVDADTGKTTTKSSLLLASGYWGTARHLHYLFELMAAYSWCLLANPMRNGALPMLYCSFLTVLLMHRAKRDEEKCLAKYGKDFTQYMQLVPWRVIPNVY